MRKYRKLLVVGFVAVLVLVLHFLMRASVESEEEEVKPISRKADGSVKEDRELISRMELIHFEDIAFIEDATFKEAMNFMLIELEGFDSPSALKPLLKRKVRTLSDEIKRKRIGELQLKNASLAEILDVLFLRCGCSWQIVDGELVVEKVKKERGLEVLLRLDEIKLPVVEFDEDATFRDGINFLRLRAREMSEGAAEEKGVSFVIRNASVETSSEVMPDEEMDEEFQVKDGINERRIGELLMRNVSIKEALVVMCRRSGVKWHLEDYAFIFSDR